MTFTWIPLAGDWFQAERASGSLFTARKAILGRLRCCWCFNLEDQVSSTWPLVAIIIIVRRTIGVPHGTMPHVIGLLESLTPRLHSNFPGPMARGVCRGVQAFSGGVGSVLLLPGFWLASLLSTRREEAHTHSTMRERRAVASRSVVRSSLPCLSVIAVTVLPSP